MNFLSHHFTSCRSLPQQRDSTEKKSGERPIEHGIPRKRGERKRGEIYRKRGEICRKRGREVEKRSSEVHAFNEMTVWSGDARKEGLLRGTTK